MRAKHRLKQTSAVLRRSRAESRKPSTDQTGCRHRHSTALVLLARGSGTRIIILSSLHSIAMSHFSADRRSCHSESHKISWICCSPRILINYVDKRGSAL